MMMQWAENPSAGSGEVGRGSLRDAYGAPSAERRIDPLRVGVWGGLLLLISFTWAFIAAGLLALL